MMAYLSLKRENLWDIDPRNACAHWFVMGTFGTNTEMFKALYAIFEKIIEIGTISKIIYPTPYVTNLASIIIENIKSSNQSFRQNIFNDIYFGDINLHLNTLLDVYLEEGIISMVFDQFNKQHNLELLGHPSKEKGYVLNLFPFSISLSLSTKNNYFELGIKIYTDIYFPYVLCPWEWKKKYDDQDETGPSLDELDYAIHGFDNRELSQLNGKRINFFLTDLKYFVDNYDRIEWNHFETEHWLGYHKMVNEFGINLNYPRS